MPTVSHAHTRGGGDGQTGRAARHLRRSSQRGTNRLNDCQQWQLSAAWTVMAFNVGVSVGGCFIGMCGIKSGGLRRGLEEAGRQGRRRRLRELRRGCRMRESRRKRPSGGGGTTRPDRRVKDERETRAFDRELALLSAPPPLPVPPQFCAGLVGLWTAASSVQESMRRPTFAAPGGNGG